MANNIKRNLKIGIRIIACLYAVVLFYLNVIRCFDEALWLDEAFTANLVRESIVDIFKITANDVHPPLYYLIVKGFCSVFGMKGWAFHFVSVVPLIITLIFLLTVVWDSFGPEVSLIVMTLIGISDEAVTYNVQIRMYSWAALFVLLSWYCFYLIVTHDSKKDYIGFSCFTLAAAYTHYYALIAVAFFYVLERLCSKEKI